MKYQKNEFTPIIAVTVQRPPRGEALAFSSLVLSAYEEVGPDVAAATAPHVVLVTEGAVTLRFSGYDRHLEGNVAMHIPANAPYSLWNHTPWRSRILRADLVSGSTAASPRAKRSLSSSHVCRTVRERAKDTMAPRFNHSRFGTKRMSTRAPFKRFGEAEAC